MTGSNGRRTTIIMEVLGDIIKDMEESMDMKINIHVNLIHILTLLMQDIMIQLVMKAANRSTMQFWPRDKLSLIKSTSRSWRF